MVARPWGEKSTARGKVNPDTDFSGDPLWLDSDRAIVDSVERIAKERDVSMVTVALVWGLQNPIVDAPIGGATKEHHLTDAVAALDLTTDEITALEQSYVMRAATYF